MKPRKELKAGDWVKFYGYTSEGMLGYDLDWHTVLNIENDNLVLISYECLPQYIHRNQVYRVLRKVKKKKYYIWLKNTSAAYLDNKNPFRCFLETTLKDMSHDPEWTKFVEVKK